MRIGGWWRSRRSTSAYGGQSARRAGPLRGRPMWRAAPGCSFETTPRTGRCSRRRPEWRRRSSRRATPPTSGCKSGVQDQDRLAPPACPKVPNPSGRRGPAGPPARHPPGTMASYAPAPAAGPPWRGPHPTPPRGSIRCAAADRWAQSARGRGRRRASGWARTGRPSWRPPHDLQARARERERARGSGGQPREQPEDHIREAIERRRHVLKRAHHLPAAAAEPSWRPARQDDGRRPRGGRVCDTPTPTRRLPATSLGTAANAPIRVTPSSTTPVRSAVDDRV